MTQGAIRERVAALGRWFHNTDLNGVQTAPDHFLGNYPAVKWRRFGDAIPSDLRGRMVLDIGCHGGFYSIEMKRRGAERVVGVDFDGDYLAQASFAAEVCGADIEFRRMSVYELGRLCERFDLVLFVGVLYHLRYPLLALDLIHEHVTRDLLVFQPLMRGSAESPQLEDDYRFFETAPFGHPGYPRPRFVEGCYAGDCTNWWIPNPACAQAMLRSAGYEILDHPEEDVLICRHARTVRPADDLLARCGRG